MAASKSPPGAVRFGVLELDVKAGELRKHGIKIRLQEQPFQVLAMLIEHAGEVVTKEELRERIWASSTFVDFDHGLHSAMARVREALGDSAENPRFIETLPRRGYRFVAPIRVLEAGIDAETETLQTVDPQNNRLLKFAVIILSGLLAGAAALALLLEFDIGGARRWLRRQSNPTIHSLAVLPLQNLSGDPAQDYFADGMTDALIADLSRIGALPVISRTSAMHFKGTKQKLPEIARELNVDGIVEGSVIRAGNRVRITAQLIYAATDQHIWAETYERDVGDVLKLQSEVALDIAQQVRVQLTSQQRANASSVVAVIPEAYEAYLRGRYFWNQRTEAGLWKSVELFQQAIAIDPNWAPPYTGIADAYLVLGSWALEAVPEPEVAAKVRGFIEKALRLDPTLAEVHTVAAGLEHGMWNWNGAEAEYRRAIELNPNYAHAHQWYSQLLCELKRFDECLTEADRAHALDPLNLTYGIDVGNRLYWARHYKDATSPIKKMLELDPNFTRAHTLLGFVYEQNGMYEDAIRELQRAVELSRNNPMELGALGHVYAVSGRRNQAFQVIEQLHQVSAKHYMSSYQFAVVYLGLGKKDEAVQFLEKAYQEHSSWILHLKVDPRLDPLRSDPRFQSILRRSRLE